MAATTFTIGRIKEFDESKEDIEVYIERLEHWMTANTIAAPTTDQADAIDLGAKTYGIS